MNKKTFKKSVDNRVGMWYIIIVPRRGGQRAPKKKFKNF